MATPAMAAGVADHIWTLEEIAALLDWLERNARGITSIRVKH
jgi:hypothetical protein